MDVKLLITTAFFKIKKTGGKKVNNILHDSEMEGLVLKSELTILFKEKASDYLLSILIKNNNPTVVYKNMIIQTMLYNKSGKIIYQQENYLSQPVFPNQSNKSQIEIKYQCKKESFNYYLIKIINVENHIAFYRHKKVKHPVRQFELVENRIAKRIENRSKNKNFSIPFFSKTHSK